MVDRSVEKCEGNKFNWDGMELTKKEWRRQRDEHLKHLKAVASRVRTILQRNVVGLVRKMKRL